MRLLGALLIWLVLVVISTAGFVTALLSLLTFRAEYLTRVFKMHDRTAAVVLGLGDGSRTVSYECGLQFKAGNPCRFCRWTDPIVSWLLRQGDHYAEEVSDGGH